MTEQQTRTLLARMLVEAAAAGDRRLVQLLAPAAKGDRRALAGFRRAVLAAKGGGPPLRQKGAGWDGDKHPRGQPGNAGQFAAHAMANDPDDADPKLPPGTRLTAAEWEEAFRRHGLRPRRHDDIADRPAPEPDAAAAALTAAWAAANPHIPEEVRRRYAADLAAVLTGMPAASRAAAEHALRHDPPRFYASEKEVTRAWNAIRGTNEKGVVGFVRGLTASTCEMHIDGGSEDDPANTYRRAGTYAHELGHCVDVGERYSGTAGWRAAYRKDILNGKCFLGRLALRSPGQAFAEVYRLMHEKGVEAIRVAFPTCHKFLAKEKLV